MDDGEDRIPFITGDLSTRDFVTLIGAVVRMAAARGWGFRVEQLREVKQCR